MPSGLDLLEDVGKTNLAPKSNLPPFDIALQPGADPEEEAMKLASSKSGLDLLALEEKKVVEPTKIVPEDNAGILSTIANFFKSEPTYTPAPEGTKPASPTTMYNEYGTPTEYAGAGPIMVASRPESLPTEPPKLESPKTELQTAQGAGKLAKDVLANKYPSAKNSYLLQTARMFDLPEKLPPDLGKVIISGYARSVGGTRARARGGNFPTLTPEEYGKLGAFGQFAHSLITFGFDLPVYMVGGMIGSAAGPPGAVGGAFGFAEGLRSYYDQQLEKGEVTGPRDFLDRSLKTGLETLKGVATGKVMEKAGALGKATGVPFAKTIAEAGALAAVPAALEARFPTKEEYYDAASFLLGLNVITRGPKAIGKMREIFRKTGRLPSELKKDVETDPKLADVLTNEEDKVPEDVIQRAKEKVAETAKIQADLEAAKELAKKRPTAEELVTEELKEKGKKVRKAKGKKVEEEVVEEPVKEEREEELLDERDVYLELRTLGYSDKDIKGMAKKQKELIVDQGIKKGWKSEEELAKEKEEGKVKKRRGKKAAEVVKVEEPKVEEPTTKVKKPRKRIKPDPITPIDEDLGESPTELKGADHPFRDKDPEHTKVMSDLYRDKVKNASATPELYVRYLINGVNRYLNGEEVPIEKIRDGLSELATRSEELRGKFAKRADFENFRETAEEAAKWARTTDRLNVKRTRGPSEVQLNMMIPVDQLPEMVKDVMKGIKAGTTRFGNLYRNREVWDKTGFWLGKDGKWRYEIDDNKLSIDLTPLTNKGQYGGGTNITNIIRNFELFKDVPELEKVRVDIIPEIKDKGDYNPSTKVIRVGKADKSTVIHELQHAVNDIVGSKFRGSNVEVEKAKAIVTVLDKMREAVKSPEILDQLNRIADEYKRTRNLLPIKDRIEMAMLDANTKANSDYRKMVDIYSEIASENKAFENYMKDPGEMEARLASARMEMSAEERRRIPPWETLDNMLIDEGVKYDFDAPTSNKSIGSTLYMGIDPTQMGPFYSKLKEVISSIKQDKFLTSDLFKMLKGKQVTDAEIENTLGGLRGKDKVTKKDIMEEVEANTTKFEDVILKDSEGATDSQLAALGYELSPGGGRTKFSQYVEPGAVPGSYREMFVTVPSSKETRYPIWEEYRDYYKKQGLAKTPIAEADLQFQFKEDSSRGRFEKGLLDELGIETESRWQDGHSAYSDIQNPIVRIRYNDREINGKKILFVEEIQGPSEANQAKMPEALRKRIYDTGVKRVLALAKEGGYDGVAWTTGKMQVDRYEGPLRQAVDKMIWEDGNLVVYKSGNEVLSANVDSTGKIIGASNTEAIGKDLAEVVGKPIAERLLKTGADIIEGKDLTIGGQGLKALYDKTLPVLFKKYGKEGMEKVTIKSPVEGWDTVKVIQFGTDRYGLLITPRVPEARRSMVSPFYKEVTMQELRNTLGDDLAQAAIGLQPNIIPEIIGKKTDYQIINPFDGTVLVEKGTTITPSIAEDLIATGIERVELEGKVYGSSERPLVTNNEINFSNEEINRSSLGDVKVPYTPISSKTPSSYTLYSGIDPTQIPEATKKIIAGAKRLAAYTAEARGMKAFKPRAAADTAMHELIRSGVDRSGNIRRDLLDKLGDEGYRIIQAMYLSKGASSLAVQQLKQMRKEVYGGLDKNDRRILDNLILADRMLDIGKYKTAKEFKFPEGLTPTEAAAYNELFQFTEKIIPEKASELQQRAKSYFEWMKKPLKDMLEAELITQEEYDALASHNYRRLKLVDIFDRRYQAKIGKKSRTVYDSGVEALARGRETDVFEPSSEIMALEVFNRAYGRILNNAANRTLLDLARNNKENPFVRIKDEKGEKIPTGWNRIYVYEKGERQALYLSPEMSKEWITNNPEMSYKLSQIIRYASGSPVLRTFATGIDWGFALANLPRDVMHAWFATRVFNGKNWESAYSPHLPVFGMQMLHDQLSVFTDVLLRRGVYEDYIKEGGGMEFLVHQGRLLQRGRHIEGRLDKLQDFLGYLGETTELMTRASIRNRVIRKRANELGISFDEAYRNEKIRTEATFAARDYMDFGQGGGVGKALDNGIPYLNASIQGTRGLFRSARDNPMEFTYKLAQFATVVSGLYIANQAINPDTMKDLKGSIDMQNNLCIPLGDKLGFVDEKGQMRYIYFKIPIDPGQKFFKSLFEAGTDKWLGNEVDTEAIANTFTQISPVGISSLPPTMSGTLGYMVNKDFWKDEEIWKKTEQPSSWQLPKMLTGEQIGGSEEEFIPGRTPQMYTDLGKVTGLSPERAKYAIEQLITSGSMWGWMVGQGYEKVLGELPQDKREMHIAEALTKIPVIRRFIGITDPYAKFAQPIKETKEEGMFERWTQNRGLDAKVEGYLYQGNVERSEITDYIKSFKDKDTQDRLKDRFEFSVNIKELPNRSFWLSLKGVQDVDARAKLLNDRMRSSNDEQRAQLYIEIATVEKAGGIISEDFKKAFMKYRPESVQ